MRRGGPDTPWINTPRLVSEFRKIERFNKNYKKNTKKKRFFSTLFGFKIDRLFPEKIIDRKKKRKEKKERLMRFKTHKKRTMAQTEREATGVIAVVRIGDGSTVH